MNDPLEVMFQVAEAHHDAGRLAEAELLYRQILSRRPDHPDALHYLGLLAYQVGNYAAAEALIRGAISIKPDVADLHNNLGETLRTLRKFDDAIMSLRRAIALEPANPSALNNLGSALGETGRIDDAIECFQQAIVLKPDYAEAHSNLGHVLTGVRRIGEAIASYRRALALKPNFVHCHSQLLLLLNYHSDHSAAAIAQEAERWRLSHAVVFESQIPPHSSDRATDRRLRIGYVSADFFEHPCAYFLDPLLRSHDRSQFEIFCYSHVVNPDAHTARFQKMPDVWRSIVGMSDDHAADLVRSDEIDILVDLKLHTQSNRLLIFARKPAPVQVSWLGYPGTTGLRSIGYRLTDPHLDPPDQDESVYSEQSVRLPDTFWCYDPLTSEPAVNPPPAETDGSVTFGCLNNFAKITDQTLQLWARLLHSVPRSRLLMLAPEGRAREAAMEVLRDSGVSADRVEFVRSASRAQYLKLYHRIDIALDTLPYNGHTTSLDSLWMGVPVITLVGSTAVGRAGMSQLTNVGLTELIARTPEQFINIAAQLAGDLARMREMRSTLRNRMQLSPLMDAPHFARGIEEAYRQMWRQRSVASPGTG